MDEGSEAPGNGGKTAKTLTCVIKVSPYQDSCWSWLVCFAAVLSNVIICGFTYSFGILFPALLDEFQQGKAKTGTLCLKLVKERRGESTSALESLCCD